VEGFAHDTNFAASFKKGMYTDGFPDMRKKSASFVAMFKTNVEHDISKLWQLIKGADTFVRAEHIVKDSACIVL